MTSCPCRPRPPQGTRCASLWLGALAMVIVTAAGSAVAFGAEPSAEAKERARVLQIDARDYFTNGDYAASIAALEQAFALVPHDNFLFNIAMTYDAWGGHCKEAFIHFRRFFDACGECSSRKPAEKRYRVFQARCTAQITFETMPSGAHLEVDGFALGRAPLEAQLPAGKHLAAAVLDGYTVSTRTFIVEAGMPLRIAIELEKEVREGRLVLRNIPPDATLSIDGNPVEGADHTLAAGAHQLEVKAPWAAPAKLDIQMNAGATLELDLAAADLPAPTGGVVEHPTDRNRNIAWIALAAGGVGVVAGAAFSYMAIEDIDEEERARDDQAPESRVNTLRDSARRNAILANVGFGLGLVGLGTGAILLYLDDQSPPQQATWQPTIGVRGVGITGRF